MAPLGSYGEVKILRFVLNLLTQDLWEWSPGICVLTSSLYKSFLHCMRTTVSTDSRMHEGAVMADCVFLPVTRQRESNTWVAGYKFLLANQTTLPKMLNSFPKSALRIKDQSSAAGKFLLKVRELLFFSPAAFPAPPPLCSTWSAAFIIWLCRVLNVALAHLGVPEFPVI